MLLAALLVGLGTAPVASSTRTSEPVGLRLFPPPPDRVVGQPFETEVFETALRLEVVYQLGPGATAAGTEMSAQLIDADGQFVRDLSLGSRLDGASLVWNAAGTGPAAPAVPDGDYVVRFRARQGPYELLDDMRVVVDRSTTALVDITTDVAPDTSIFTIDVRPVDPTSTITAVTGVVDGARRTVTAPDPDGVWRVRHDADAVDDGGTVFADVWFRDRFGFEHRTGLLAPSVVATRPLPMRTLAQEALIGRGTDLVAQPWRGEYTVAEFATWSVDVLDASGQTVRRLVDASDLFQVEVAWDGTDLLGAPVPDGTYFVRATAATADARIASYDTRLVVDRRPVLTQLTPRPGDPAVEAHQAVLVAGPDLRVRGSLTADGRRVLEIEPGVYISMQNPVQPGDRLSVQFVSGGLIANAVVDLVDPPPADGNDPGYWMVSESGIVFSFGSASTAFPFAFGAGARVVGFDRTPDGQLVLLADDGTVQSTDPALRLGGIDLAGLDPGELPAALSVTPTGGGYWVFTDRGRVQAFGDARSFGDLYSTTLDDGTPIGRVLNGPLRASVPTPSGEGYYMIASDGGVFAFGDASFRGSMGGRPLNEPVVGIAPDPDGVGYWLVAADGGIFAFDAPFRGSVPGVLAPGARLNQPVIGAIAYGDGYLLVAADGGIFSFSDLDFRGSLGSVPLTEAIVGVAAVG